MYTNCKPYLPSRQGIYDQTPPPDKYQRKYDPFFDESLRTKRTRRSLAVDSASLRALASLESQLAETHKRIAAMRAKQQA